MTQPPTPDPLPKLAAVNAQTVVLRCQFAPADPRPPELAAVSARIGVLRCQFA